MKRILLPLLILLFTFFFSTARPVRAQAETPPAGPVGEIRGTVINRNSGKLVTENLEVMLHVLNLDLVEKDMKHSKSQTDGTFVFPDVPFDANTQFAVMATYDGVTYFSETVPADMSSMQVNIDMPVYETTKDLSAVQIDQMHILFESSPDGLEMKELYIISNSGERTVKDVYDLGNDKFAVLKFPLPGDADYVFFKPDDQDRFVKLDGAFADTYPLLPGDQPAQVLTSYLVPFTGERTYTYKAPANTARINFLVPVQANISLQGSGLEGPQSTTLQDGSSYSVYSYADLKTGQTLSVTVTGKINDPQISNKTNNLIAIGTAFLGFALIGAGIRWWRKPESSEDEKTAQSGEQTLAELIAEIAGLDEAHEQGELSSEQHQRERQALMKRAKQLL